MEIKVTERGWAGHLCVSSYCLFKRNTLVEKGKKKLVVSTVGNYRSPVTQKPDTIGLNRYYETMVFKARKEGVYWEAETSNELPFESNWSLNEIEEGSDKKANDMHEKVVKEIVASLT